MNNMRDMIETIHHHTMMYRSEPIGENILEAMQNISREDFGGNYVDGPQSIGHGQTISQPFIVAIMTDLLQLSKTHTVLEIGTGSGYQTAILSQLAKEIYTVERIKPLAEKAIKRLEKEYKNIFFRVGDGYKGWEAHAPYDRIIVTAGAPYVPKHIQQQLKIGGRLVIPLLDENNVEQLTVVEKQAHTIQSKSIFPVRFVPLLPGISD